MSVTATDYAAINVQTISRADVNVGKLTLVEFDGTNASDVTSWMSTNSVSNGSALREDSGDLFLTTQAITNYFQGFYLSTYAKAVEVQLQSGDRLMVHEQQGNKILLGIFDEANVSQFGELA